MELTEADVIGLVGAFSPTLGGVVKRLLDEVRSKGTPFAVDVSGGIGLGHATWVWDQDMGLHLPVCSGWKHDIRRGGLYRCGNGPLTGENIDTGLCDEGPHLEPHERSI